MSEHIVTKLLKSKDKKKSLNDQKTKTLLYTGEPNIVLSKGSQIWRCAFYHKIEILHKITPCSVILCENHEGKKPMGSDRKLTSGCAGWGWAWPERDLSNFSEGLGTLCTLNVAAFVWLHIFIKICWILHVKMGTFYFL